MNFALAVDLGGTKVEAALVDGGGVLLLGSRARAATGPGSTVESLSAGVAEVVRGALAALPSGSVLAGAGIGSAGPVDLPGGTVSPLNLPGAAGFPIVDVVATLVPGVPVNLALDGLCIALAERWVGAGRGTDSLLGMVVSTGVGGGLILGGRPIRGGTGNAGHIGQIEVGGFTEAGVSGDSAMLESVASGPNTVSYARSRGWTGSTGEELAAAYAQGVPVALEAVGRSAAAVGRAVASVTALCDVDLVVIGGGFSRVTPDYLELVRASRDRDTTPSFVRRARIAPSGLGTDGPLVGAAALVLRSAPA